MKIKVIETDYDTAIASKQVKKFVPKKPNILFRTLLKIVCTPDLIATKFKLNKINMDKLGKKEPCLYLMNHSSFIDPKIALASLYPKPVNIISTLDGLVGKRWLMRNLGCVPTRKYVPDLQLIKDMNYCLKKLNTSVIMYPEAVYSFDGTAIPLPTSLGKCIKLLGVPVVFIKTYGAFLRDPLYNNLQLRKINVSADMEYILSPDDVKNMSVDQINDFIKEKFTFDEFRWQRENSVKIDEPFRTDGLNRVLYKCPSCKTEHQMLGKGTKIVCENCKKEYYLDEYGTLSATNGITEFDHIPDWYAWQRDEVKKEILDGKYNLKTDVDIYLLLDSKALYKVGDGVLTHTTDGFTLNGCDGKIDFKQSPLYYHSLNADYFWYEIGDVIAIGDNDVTYYCFPKNCPRDIVTKTRFAVEELYKLKKQEKNTK